MNLSTRTFLIILASLGPLLLSAQQDETLDRVYLRNGRSVYGHILRWYEDGGLSFRDTSDVVWDYQSRDFRRIGYRRLPTERNSTAAYDFTEDNSSKSSFRIDFGFGFGRRENVLDFSFFPQSRNTVSFQLGLMYTYQLTDALDIGAGIHFAAYRFDRDERTLGPSLRARYRLNSGLQQVGVFIQAESAYELPIGSRGLPISEREGGVAIHPSIGFEFQQTESGLGRLSFDLGYRFLKTAYRVETNGGSEFRRPAYRRLVLRAAYTL